MNFKWIASINEKIQEFKFEKGVKTTERRKRTINRKIQKKQVIDQQKEAKEKRIIAGLIKLTANLDKLKLTDEQKRNFVLNAQKFNAERFLKDNERIWSVSTLFIPLSLAGLSSLKEKELIVNLLLGVASIALISFWYLASEKLRRFQDENLDMVTIFDMYLGINTSEIDVKIKFPEKVEREKNLSFIEWSDYWREYYLIFLRDTRIQDARLYIFQFIVVVWLIVIFGYSFFWLFTIISRSADQIQAFLYEAVIFLIAPIGC